MTSTTGECLQRGREGSVAHHPVPLDAVTDLDDDEVRIDGTHDHVAEAPDYDPCDSSISQCVWNEPFMSTRS